MQASLLEFIKGDLPSRGKLQREYRDEFARLIMQVFRDIELEVPNVPVKYSEPTKVEVPTDNYKSVGIKAHYYPERLFKADDKYKEYVPIEATLNLERNGKKYRAWVTTNLALVPFDGSFIGKNPQNVLKKAKSKIEKMLEYSKGLESKPIRDNYGRIIARTHIIRSGGTFDVNYLLPLTDDLRVNLRPVSPLKLNEIPGQNFELLIDNETLIVQIDPRTYKNYQALKPAIDFLLKAPDKYYHLEVTEEGGILSSWYSFVDEKGVMHPFIAAVFKFEAKDGIAKGSFTYYSCRNREFVTRELTVELLENEIFQELFKEYNKGIVITEEIVRSLRANLRSTMEALAIHLKKEKYRPIVKKGRKEMTIDFKNKKGTRIELIIDFKAIEFKLFVDGVYQRSVRWDATRAEEYPWALTEESLFEYLVNL